MKKLFTLFATSLLSVSLFALPSTKLSITSNSKNAVSILVDGKNYSSAQAANDIVINNLAAGAHNIKVYQQRNNNGFSNSGKAVKLIYDGNVYVKPQTHVDVTINRAGYATITEKPIGMKDYPANSANGGWNYRYPQVMNDRTFDQLRYTINKTSFENPKMNVARQVISQNYFTTTQVKELLGSFNYESSRLEMAKYAYSHTLDKENYFDVINSLCYSSSKEELAKWLQQAN